jgi:hypothetical protein
MTTMMLYHCNETHVLGIEPGNPHSSNETFSVGPGQGVYNATSSRARYANSVAAPLYAYGQTRRGRQNATHDQQPDNEPEQAQYAREDLCRLSVSFHWEADGRTSTTRILTKRAGSAASAMAALEPETPTAMPQSRLQKPIVRPPQKSA